MIARVTYFLLVVSLVSCDKTDPVETLTPLLARMETTQAGETVTTTIEYKREKPILMQAVGVRSGAPVNTTTRFVRNEKDVLEKIIIKNPAYLTTFTIDSIIYNVNYSNADDRYTSMVNYLFFRNGTTEYDSVYFTYDVAGTVIQATKLIKTGSSAGYQEGERNEFTYAGSNLIRCKNYQFGSLFLEQNVVYDVMTNPMGFGKEWILIGSTRNNRNFERASSNNPTTVSFLNANGNVSTTKTTYAYRLDGYPAIKTDVLANGSIQSTTYHY